MTAERALGRLVVEVDGVKERAYRQGGVGRTHG
jgi:hypothetical protein